VKQPEQLALCASGLATTMFTAAAIGQRSRGACWSAKPPAAGPTIQPTFSMPSAESTDGEPGPVSASAMSSRTS